jgi:hypothetical protein
MSRPRIQGVPATENVTNAGSKGTQTNAARRAAEALFRPAHPHTPTDHTPNVGGPPSSSHARTARILPVVDAAPEQPRETGATFVAATGGRLSRRDGRSRAVTSSQYGRIRTLVSYGMTIDQVAQLYRTSAGRVRSIVEIGTPPE